MWGLVSWSSSVPELTTLKYRSEVGRNPRARLWSRISHSPMSLLSPQGDSGRVGVPSVTRPARGLPYTAADEEKTMFRTPTLSMAVSR